MGLKIVSKAYVPAHTNILYRQQRHAYILVVPAHTNILYRQQRHAYILVLSSFLQIGAIMMPFTEWGKVSLFQIQ
jgi:hypothetical protein